MLYMMYSSSLIGTWILIWKNYLSFKPATGSWSNSVDPDKTMPLFIKILKLGMHKSSCLILFPKHVCVQVLFNFGVEWMFEGCAEGTADVDLSQSLRTNIILSSCSLGELSS